mmetsp:Transcript_13265/g.17358  ORF Transcript_13265/g.17358 Transcript_13265/m.17358 type:complete len:365 (-) Transcript_13265:126-1220(-)
MGKLGTVAVIFVVVVTIAMPILISEAIGGWTKKYTSPAQFTPSKIPDLRGKVAIVTGANTGIGYETALELAGNGAHVIIAARNEAKGMAALSKIQEQIKSKSNPGELTFIQLDLASLKSVKRFAKSFKKTGLPLNILVLNAGVMKSPGAKFIGQEMTYGFDVTADGFEYHIGVNHIAHAYLVNLLSSVLTKSSPSRIISVSSSAEINSYEEGFRFNEWKVSDMPEKYEDGNAYGQSKLANLVYAKELSDRYANTGVTVYSCHPGVIKTELGRFMEPYLIEQNKGNGVVASILSAMLYLLFDSSMMTADVGAYTQLYLATAPADELVNGAFYHPVGILQTPSHNQAQNATLQQLLWEETAQYFNH